MEMENGQCSGLKQDGQPWAKLVPRDGKYEEIEIRSEEQIICSVIKESSPDVVSWCAISRDGFGYVTIRSTSPTIIIVDGNVVNEKPVPLKNGNEIISGPYKAGHLSYVFQEAFPSCRSLKISLDYEHAKCSICSNIWHDAVSVSPCLHNFCNGCFSEWLRKSSTKSGGSTPQSVTCPQCGFAVYSVGRNYVLHKIEEAILQTNSSLKGSNEKFALADSLASIKAETMFGVLKDNPTKRNLAEENGDGGPTNFPCPQCGIEIEGFKCSQTMPHLQCRECRGRMPSRPDIGVPQHCLGCNGAFCGAYWQSQKMNWNEFSIYCSPEKLKSISERSISKIPNSVHQNNQYERDVTERCISQMGNTLQDVLSEWFGKFTSKELDISNLQLIRPEIITARTPLCDGCYEKFVDYLLYWFRVTLPPNHFPPDAVGRQNCWFGSGCRTQHHNSEHARYKNHVCRPTKTKCGAHKP